MLKLEWNSLRVGDKVLVHDGTDPTMTLLPGVVGMVRTKRGATDIGVRLGPAGAPDIRRPTRLSVHLDPLDPARSCWRCDAIEAAAVAI